jgi:aspartyl-tRNA(Asn)/glutamyl-tRNA(Gln) amidotransferase subunit B
VRGCNAGDDSPPPFTTGLGRRRRWVEFDSVVGVEIHVQLATESKLFCRCASVYGAQPNTNVCPVCLGLPGSLPVVNREAFELGIRTAVALSCEASSLCMFDRKNYFYPDLPKSYQITQHYTAVGRNGRVEIEDNGSARQIAIERVHIEEDAGKIVYDETTGESLIDFNRCGVPLLEIVTKPWVTTPEEVYKYLAEIKQILQYIGVSDCDMEKGNLRCDVNISVMERGAQKFGTRTEIKNLNSFRAVQKALEYEKKRQIELIRQGKKVVVETLLWDEISGKTFLQRSKEQAQDYRYFPEPDLRPFVISEEWLESVRSEMVELPSARRERFVTCYSLPRYDAGVLTADREIAEFFEKCVALHNSPKIISNWIMSEVMKMLNEKKVSISRLNLKPAQLVELIKLVESGEVTNLIARDVLAAVIETGKSPRDIIVESGLRQESAEAVLRQVVDEVIADNPAPVAEYKKGKKTAAQFLIGQVMKETKGKANPQIVAKLIAEALDRV